MLELIFYGDSFNYRILFMIIINSLKSSKQPQDGNIKKNITCFTIKMKNYTKLF